MSKRISKDTLKIVFLFLGYKVLLFLILFFAIKFIPLANIDKYLGGGGLNYNLMPELFSWANFDGEHYLSISIFGYKNLQQAFFPVYPMLINFIASPISFDLLSGLINSTIIFLIISNTAFLIVLLYLVD